MIEAVHGISLGGWSAIEHLQELGVVLLRQRLHFYPDIPLPHQLQDFAEKGHSFAVPQANVACLRKRELSDRANPRDVEVVVNHDSTVSRGMDIELDPIRIQHDGATESRTRVLVLVPGSTPVRDNRWPWHRLRYSAVLGRPT